MRNQRKWEMVQLGPVSVFPEPLVARTVVGHKPELCDCLEGVLSASGLDKVLACPHLATIESFRYQFVGVRFGILSSLFEF